MPHTQTAMHGQRQLCVAATPSKSPLTAVPLPAAMTRRRRAAMRLLVSDRAASALHRGLHGAREAPVGSASLLLLAND